MLHYNRGPVPSLNPKRENRTATSESQNGSTNSNKPSPQCKKKKIDFRVNVKLSFKKKEFGSILDTLIQSDGHVEEKAVISKDQHNK